MDEIIEAVEKISTPLPAFMEKSNTCCFTGHRGIPEKDRAILVELLDTVVRGLCDNGNRYFVCGGALGFDMLAEQAVIRAINDGYKAELILALPCANQTERWRTDTKNGLSLIREYQRIKGFASSIRYISETSDPDCMKRRNQYMVDLSSSCVAYYSGKFKSGASQTYRMARKAGLDILNLYDAIEADRSDY